MVSGLGGKDESFLWAGCWIAVMGEFGKDSYQHGSPSEVMWKMNFRWIQESVYLLPCYYPQSEGWVVDIL